MQEASEGKSHGRAKRPKSGNYANFEVLCKLLRKWNVRWI